MLGQRRRRWAKIAPALIQYPVFAGNIIGSYTEYYHLVTTNRFIVLLVKA